MKTLNFILPSCFACALINADYSGLSDNDIKLLDNFEAENIKQYNIFYCINADVENIYFSPFNDLSGMKNIGADVCNFTFVIE
jgi:hypothetical protein